MSKNIDIQVFKSVTTSDFTAIICRSIWLSNHKNDPSIECSGISFISGFQAWVLFDILKYKIFFLIIYGLQWSILAEFQTGQKKVHFGHPGFRDVIDILNVIITFCIFPVIRTANLRADFSFLVQRKMHFQYQEVGGCYWSCLLKKLIAFLFFSSFQSIRESLCQRETS